MTGSPAPITAAVASCDRPEALIRCVTGILANSTLPAEIIVVDQSSDSRVEDAVAKVTAPTVPIRLSRQPRRGLSASRNQALTLASQPAVAFTDDDCVPDAGWIGAIHAALAADPGLAAVTGRVLPLGDERPGTHVVSPRYSAEAQTYRGRTAPWSVGTGGNFAARVGWLERVRGFDERLGAGSPGRAAEDAELLYRLLLAGAVIRYDPSSVVFHERQSSAQRLASRRGYGHGIGAFCTLYLRRGDLFAARMLGSYLKHQSASLARASWQRDWFAARQRLLALRGCAAGVRYGVGLR
jgi:GT2 family glycosyltransferase